MDEITTNPQIAPVSNSRILSMEDYRKQQTEMSDQEQELEAGDEPEDELEQDAGIDLEDKPIDTESIVDPLLDLPPSYDASTQSQNMRSRLINIQPREDEGKETLPGYSAGISLENVFMRKMELQGAIHRASDRNWYRVFATLQGTLLAFHKYKGPGIFGNDRGEQKGTPDLPAGTRRGCLLESYNLQHADVGIAADYVKYFYMSSYRNCNTNSKQETLCHSCSSRSRSIPSIMRQD